MKIEGVIFDLDGTLLDSTWVWSQIDTDFLKKRGFEVPKDYSTAIMAMGFEEVAKYTIKRFLLQETKEDVMAEWDAMAREDRKSTRLNSSHVKRSRMPSSA